MEKSEKPSKTQMWSALFIGAIIMNLCVCSVGQSTSAGTPLYIQSIGGTNTYSGILLSVYILAAMCGRFVSGRLTDSTSRRFVIMISSAIIVVGSALPLIIPYAEILFASRILQGLGFACAQTAIGAYAADVLPYKRLGEGLGFFGLGQAFAMAVGPAFSVWLVSLEYTEALSVGIGGIGAVMLAIGCFIRYEKNPSKLPVQSSYRLIWEKRKAVDIAAAKGEADDQKPGTTGFRSERLGFFEKLFERAALYGAVPAAFYSMSAAVFISYATVYAQAIGYATPSLFFVAAACSAVLVRLVSSKLMDTFSSLKLLAVSLLCGIATLFIITFVQNETVYYCSGFLYGICVGIAIPLLSAVAIKASPSNRYGAANALYFLIYDIGFGLGSVGWGFLLDIFGFTTIFMGSAVCFVLSFAMACVLFPHAEALSRKQSGI